MRHLAGHPPRAFEAEVGDRVDLRPLPGQPGYEFVVLETPAGEGLRLDAQAAVFQPGQPGIYAIHKAGAQSGGPSAGASLSLNLPRSEITSLQQMDRPLALTPGGQSRPADAAGRTDATVRREADTATDTLWWYLCLAAALLLILEAALAPPRKFSPGAST